MLNELSQIIPEGLAFKEAVTAAEQIIGACPQVALEVTHHFSPGLYAREMRIPAGTVLTGKIHKTEHLCILNGDMDIASADGKGRFTGYHVFNSKPGAKRIGYAHADTTFTTIHAIDGDDIDALEAALVVETYAQYEQFLLEHTIDGKPRRVRRAYHLPPKRHARRTLPGYAGELS